MTCYPLYYARKSKGQNVTADPLILIDAYVYLLFSPEKIAPDTLLEGRNMPNNMFFFFIPAQSSSLSVPLSPLHLLLIMFSYSQSVSTSCSSVTFLKFLFFLLLPLHPSLHCFCGSVLSVLWRRSADSVHPVSPAGSPRSWLPAPPETCHFQGLQHSVLPLCPCTKLWPGHSTER